MLVPALVAFASATYINASGPVENPFRSAVTRMVTGICQPVPGEVHRILSLAKLFPSDFDPVQHGSGTLQYEPGKPERVSLASSPWDYKDVVEEEVWAVDSAETVEVDDAIHFDGDWVHVHVADSSHFAPLSSPQDHLARNRVSTIYMPTKTIPMLPEPIVSLMSLTPERLENPALTFSAKIGDDGSIMDYRIGTSVLKRIKRVTYEAADKLIETDSKLKNGLDLVQRHYRGRLASGHIPFSIPKPNAKVDPSGSISFSVDSHKDGTSKTLVSESMLIAGRVAAMYAADHKLAVPFRYHPAPISADPSIIERILAGQFTRYDTLRLLMAMSPSAVDTVPRPHWSMGLDMYAKATSPIRRYFDLLLHHQVKSSLMKKNVLTDSDLAKLLPPTYRHEQYLKHLQKASTRYWTLRHLQSILHSDPTDPRLTTSLIILDSAPSSSRQKVWVESLALILYANVLGKLPTGLMAGTQIHEARVSAVDPLRTYIEFVI